MRNESFNQSINLPINPSTNHSIHSNLDDQPRSINQSIHPFFYCSDGVFHLHDERLKWPEDYFDVGGRGRTNVVERGRGSLGAQNGSSGAGINASTAGSARSVVTQTWYGFETTWKPVHWNAWQRDVAAVCLVCQHLMAESTHVRDGFQKDLRRRHLRDETS